MYGNNYKCNPESTRLFPYILSKIDGELFSFEKSDFNIESVKQFMIQLEGDGDIYLDNIKFIKL